MISSPLISSPLRTALGAYGDLGLDRRDPATRSQNEEAMRKRKLMRASSSTPSPYAGGYQSYAGGALAPKMLLGGL